MVTWYCTCNSLQGRCYHWHWNRKWEDLMFFSSTLSRWKRYKHYSLAAHSTYGGSGEGKFDDFMQQTNTHRLRVLSCQRSWCVQRLYLTLDLKNCIKILLMGNSIRSSSHQRLWCQNPFKKNFCQKRNSISSCKLCAWMKLTASAYGEVASTQIMPAWESCKDDFWAMFQLSSHQPHFQNIS